MMLRSMSPSLVQPASFVGVPKGPRRIVVLALGLFLAALSGLATALAAAWLNPVLMTAEQVALLLDLPLSGVVPPGTLQTAA